MDPSATPQQQALAVLKSINKSVQSAIQLDDVPPELCLGEDINLDRWSIILTDDNLRVMSKQPKELFVIDPSKPDVPSMFNRFYDLKSMPLGIISLSLKDAKEITDFGLSLVLRNSPNLKHLNLTGCSKIGDVSMRELGMNCRSLLSLNLTSCHSIIGEGLVAVGDCCRQLRKLSIARCKNLEK